MYIPIILLCIFHLNFYNTVKCDCGKKVKPENISTEITSKILFLYHQGPTVNDYIRIPYEDGLTISEQKNFNLNLETVFYFHGWTETPSNNEESVDTICAAFLSKTIVNLVVLDYSQLVKGDSIPKYLDSFRNVTEIGKAIGYFLKCFIPLKQAVQKIHLIGHSLGSQVISHTAKEYGQGKLKWLTGLDPAGPIFNFPFIDHLSADDGEFVDIIHTDGYMYGDGRSIGHVDFFPNLGRRFQPSCPTNNSYPFCSHHMSWRLYAESIRNKSYFPAKECSNNILCTSYGIYSGSSWCCHKNAIIAHMGYGVNKTVRGNFYLKTSASPPYDLGEQGFYN